MILGAVYEAFRIQGFSRQSSASKNPLKRKMVLGVCI